MPAEDDGGNGRQVRVDPTLGGVKYTSPLLLLRLCSMAGGTLCLAAEAQELVRLLI